MAIRILKKHSMITAASTFNPTSNSLLGINQLG